MEFDGRNFSDQSINDLIKEYDEISYKWSLLAQNFFIILTTFCSFLTGQKLLRYYKK